MEQAIEDILFEYKGELLLANIGLIWCTRPEDGCMIRKWPAEHSPELHPKPKFLVTATAYLTAAQTL